MQEQILAGKINWGSYILELIAKYDPTGKEYTKFYLRLKSPYRSKPIDYAPKKGDFEELGLLLLGLETFTNRKLYVTKKTLKGWRDTMEFVLKAMGFNRAFLLSKKEVKVGKRPYAIRRLGRTVRQVLDIQGEEIRDHSPFEGTKIKL